VGIRISEQPRDVGVDARKHGRHLHLGGNHHLANRPRAPDGEIGI
jgi:hypothetical protein